jgi:CheY-like chemotaxis protein
VLLAGLDPNTRAIAHVSLGERIDVLESGAGEEALERARDERPDLVILDWDATSGPAIAALREDPMTRDTKVLLLVDDRQARSREVTRSGADERLTAPFSPLQLQVKLRKLLGADVVGST